MSTLTASSNTAAQSQTSTADLQQLIADVLADARARGASAAEAALSRSQGLSINVRLGEVETIEHIRDKGLGVTVYFGHRKGTASTSDLTPEALRQTVESACSIARFTAEDEYSGLADAELMATEIPDLQLHHPWDIEPDAAIALALQAEQVARDADPRITNSEGAAVGRHEAEHVYGNTHGFLAGYRSSRHSISCTVIAEDENGMQRDYWYSTARDPGKLENAADIGRKSAERALARLSARQIKTQSVPVLFSAEMARGLLQHFIAAIRGGSLYRNASFLVEHLGKPVFGPRIRIHEQPRLVGGLGSAAFDSEGVATRARDIVREGILQGYVLDSYSARRLGMQTTANAGGVHNLCIDTDDLDFAAMLARMDRGLLVTEMMGMGTNIVTGDYSRGAAGFWVENGEIQYPVEEITVAGNLREIFKRIDAIGNDIDPRSSISTGSILISEMAIAGE
ncbi:MAG: metalloprotease PmbA [Gammaproteobacteria bacterium]|nr:metalloprotease PmbA [Gammaproteobacteria bacterium]